MTPFPYLGYTRCPDGLYRKLFEQSVSETAKLRQTFLNHIIVRRANGKFLRTETVGNAEKKGLSLP